MKFNVENISMKYFLSDMPLLIFCFTPPMSFIVKEMKEGQEKIILSHITKKLIWAKYYNRKNLAAV